MSVLNKTPDTQLRAAVRDAFAIGMGYIPLGLGMGMLLAGAGMEWWWAPIFAVSLYSGSMQYLLVPMLANFDSLPAIALASIAVQFRHIFYGISYPLDLVTNKFAKVYCVHALTDEVYAVISTRPRAELSQRRIVATQVMAHLYWIIGCTLGALVGQALPLDSRILNFVLTSLFVVIAMEAYWSGARKLELFLAGGCALISLAFPSQAMLPGALTMFVLALVLLSIRELRKERGQAGEG